MTNINHYFPAWRFHPTLAPKGRLFNTQEELDREGEGWVDSPAKFDLPPPPAEVPVAPPASSERSFSAKEVKKMNKPALYDLAKNPPYSLGVPENVDDITKKELLALILPSLPEK